MAKSVENKIAIKLQLSEKYARLARLASSKVKQSTYTWHARHFRAQADVMQKALNFKKAEKAQAAN